MLFFFLQIHPSSGTIDGGTRITVSGNNLGFWFNQSLVSIAGTACQVIPDEYIVSKRSVRGGVNDCLKHL